MRLFTGLQLFFFFLFVTVALFGQVAVTENEPSALVEGIVNAVTGDLYALEDDIIIQGAEPLRLKRSYISGKGEGSWCFFENLSAVLLPPVRILKVREPNGTVLCYRYDLKEADYRKKKHKAHQQYLFHPLNLTKDAQGLTNTARGKISAHTNLKNQYVSMDKEGTEFFVVCPDGTRRTYKALEGQKPESLGSGKIYFFYNYLLVSEEFPNGNKTFYDWHKGRLTAMRTTDPSGKKTYAQATFHYHGHLKEKHGQSYLDNADFDIQTSDGRKLQYRYINEGKPEKQGRWQLHQIISSDFPLETLHYHKQLLTTFSLPQARNFQMGYYPREDDFVGNRVRDLSFPVGESSALLMTHRFSYDLSKRMTSVLDSEGVPTHYYWDENFRLSQIDRHTASQTLYCGTQFVWGTGPDAANLLGKILYDENRKALHAITYVYDSHGNVLQEKFYGNLSGCGAPLMLDSNHLPIDNGVEVKVCKFKYSQEGRHLLLQREEGNGLVVTYEYLPGTNLPISEFFYEQGSIKRRQFYEYNGDRILIREIRDDGTTPDKNDLSQVKTRLIQIIHPKPGAPYINMPQEIEERYWDGREEKLLKKIVFYYTTGGRIGKKEIYDSRGTFCYCLNYKYDEKGNLVEESNALGQSAISYYDELGNKTFFQGFGSKTHCEMQYDYSNRLIVSSEVEKEGSTHTTRHEYDKKHNRVLTIDPHGYKTRYVYDPLNQLIETHLPPLCGTDPILRSSYDAAGREITRTDARGFTTCTTYNAYGDPLLIEDPSGAREQCVYNLDGTLRTQIDQNGVETHFAYDVFKRKISILKSFEGKLLSEEIFTYDAYHLIAKTDAEGNTTQYEYDGAGRKIAESLNEERSEYGYDPLGRLHSVKQGELLSVTEYDLLDRIVEERKEDLQGRLLSKILYTYDEAGNKDSVTRFIDGKKATERFKYDPFNRLIEQEDAFGNSTLTVYNDELHSRLTTDPLGLQTVEWFNSHYLIASIEKHSSCAALLICDKYLYDGNDNITAKETTLFFPIERKTLTLWDYDPLNQLYKLTEAAGTPEQKITRYTYTKTGQLFQTMKPSGTVLTNTYDPLGFLASQISSDGTVHYTYVHNRLGHLLQSSDSIHHTSLTRTYDAKGRLLIEKLPNQIFIQNSYDLQGHRTRLDLFDGSFVNYDYDPLYLRKVTRCDSSGRSTYTHVYSAYDLAQNSLSQELIGNLGTTTRGYDLAGRPTTLRSPYLTHAILKYDAVGNVLQSQLNKESFTYTYDDLYQLTAEKEHVYTYDALYNRLRKDAASYSINALNQFPSEFEYNAEGNPRAMKGVRCSYDAFDRLISVEKSTTKLLFTYDSYHRRLSKRVYNLEEGSWSLAQELFFLYDGQNEMGSIHALGEIQELRIFGRTPQAEIGAAIAIELRGKVFAPLHDLYGNVATLVSLSDHTCEHTHYTAFGEETKPPSLSNPWRFSSKRIDDETGLIYFGRRYYLPSYGRWLTPDPLGLDVGPNLYAYVFNAPLTHHDLYGLFALNSSEDMKQMSIGAAHGVGHFALQTASAVSTMGWGLTTPLRAMNWARGKSSFSQDWNALQRSNTAFHEAGERWMHRALPGNSSHEVYRTLRSGVSSGLELGTVALGAVSLAKGAYSLAQKGFFSGYGATKSVANLEKLSKAVTKITDMRKPICGVESFQDALLNMHLTQLKKYGSQGYRQLQNNKIRYYGELKSPMKNGEMVGRRRVREWDPEKGLKRTWHETLDRDDNIRIVRPETNDGIKTHYVFDNEGNFVDTR